MANPARKHDDQADITPRMADPLNPIPPGATADPVDDPRFHPANDPRLDDPIVQQRPVGSGVLIAALVIVLAAIAYFVFAPGTPSSTVPADQPATTSEPTQSAPAPAPAENNAAPAPADNTTAPAGSSATPPAENNAAPAPDANAPAPAQ